MNAVWFIGDAELENTASPMGGIGAAYSLDSEAPEIDRVKQLRAVVEEITGKPVDRKPRRIGFL